MDWILSPITPALTGLDVTLPRIERGLRAVCVILAIVDATLAGPYQSLSAIERTLTRMECSLAGASAMLLKIC
jgi:hypothetical protein